MTDRNSMIAYIEAKAARIRANERYDALARHDATVLEAIASDLRAGMDVGPAEEVSHAR